jgi:hypothetical protein
MLCLHNECIDSNERMTGYIEKCVIYNGVMMRDRDSYSHR